MKFVGPNGIDFLLCTLLFNKYHHDRTILTYLIQLSDLEIKNIWTDTNCRKDSLTKRIIPTKSHFSV